MAIGLAVALSATAVVLPTGVPVGAQPVAAAPGPAAAGVTVLSTDDAYTSAAEPRTPHDGPRLRFGSAPGDTTVTYLRFTLPPPPAGATAVTGRLALTREGARWPETVVVSRTRTAAWTEETLTAGNAPGLGGPVAEVTPRALRRQVDIELSATALTLSGVVSLAVSSPDNRVTGLRSAEQLVGSPRLVLTYDLDDDPDPPGEGLDDVWIGACASEPGPRGTIDYGIEVFNESDADIGPLSYRRSFDTTLPASYQQSMAAPDAANGYRSFVSWKPPNGDFVGAAQGRYDDQVTAWARSVPKTGVYATAYHEPENDMTGPQFVAMQQHLYSVVKAANPTIQWGPVYMAYWWDDGTNHYIGDPDAWWVGNDYADFTAVDVYSNAGLELEVHPEFRGWYDYMVGTGERMIIAEYGQYVVPPGQTADPVKLAERAEIIAADAAWLAAEGTISMWLYWDAMGEKGDWRLNDPGSQAAWQAVATAGRDPGPLIGPTAAAGRSTGPTAPRPV